MNKWVELFTGILLIVLGVFGIWIWRKAFLVVLKGSIGALVLIVGLLFFLIAIEDFKE